MAKTRVAVIFGGVSNEHEISLLSATNIINNIPRDRYDVVCIGITKKGRWLLYIGDTSKIADGTWEQDSDNVSCILSPDPLHKGFIAILSDGKVQPIKVDVIFPVLHGKNGEDGTIQGLFTMSKIPFVGCDCISSANCMDKELTHIILQANGIKTADWMSINSYDIERIPKIAEEMEKKLKYPMFVKPANCGSSVGISKVNNLEELINGIKKAFAHDKKVVVETGVSGIECECAVMGNCGAIASTIGEIDSANEFYDYEGKYQNDESRTYIPARMSEDNIFKIRQIALEAYAAMGCTGLARVDFFLTGNGEIILNEINTLPGHTAISMYPQLMEYEGLSPSEQIHRLITLAFEVQR